MEDKKLFKHCWQCENQKNCKENHWVILFDKGQIFENDMVCDNFQLTGNQIFEIGYEDSGQHIVVDTIGEVVNFLENTDEYYEHPESFVKEDMIQELEETGVFHYYAYTISKVHGYTEGLPEFEGF